MSDTLNLNCWVFGDDPQCIFPINIARSTTVGSLRVVIKDENQHDFGGIDAKYLDLWRVKIDLATDVDSLETADAQILGDNELKPWLPLSQVFTDEPESGHLHIIVRPAASAAKFNQGQRVFKRACTDNGQGPRTPPTDKVRTERVKSQVKKSPTRLTHAETIEAMNRALEPFEQYIQYLAEGKLDSYLDSIRREDKIIFPTLGVSTDPCLLLHNLGNHPDEDRIKMLFGNGTTFLFNTSGAGKTRLSLEGLCCYWGIYLTCQTASLTPSGSGDFAAAVAILRVLSTWDETNRNIKQNADRVFTMLSCARIFVLKQLLAHVPFGTDAKAARRRWVFLQISPPQSFGEDIFTDILRSIQHADITIMQDSIRTTTNDFFGREDILLEAGRSLPLLFLVIDEAQVASKQFNEGFCSETTNDYRPILREIFKSFQGTSIFQGIILAGTGLSVEMVPCPIGSFSAKCMGRSAKPMVSSDVGAFTRASSSQDAYVRQYLTLLDNLSDQRLMERIQYWFCGRHRTTASLLELFLWQENPPRHRVLTEFVRQLTGFTITDAQDLEDQEEPISAGLSRRIATYGRLTTVDCLLERGGNANGRGREELLQCLVDLLMRWVLGSQTAPIEGHMHETIALGVGRLNADAVPKRFQVNLNNHYPVLIDEPLAVLALSSLFEKQTWATRKEWITKSPITSRNASTSGFSFEEAMLLVLMERFGGKLAALGDIFHFGQSPHLASRRVTLVALKQTAEGVMQRCPVSWKAGSSDCFGFKASSPTDVLTFFNDPRGKAFLFPDDHMGPDLTCFLRDEQTGELILLLLQAKPHKVLDAQTWEKAINFVMPEFFYTITKKAQYAPSKHPGFADDVTRFLETILGPGVCVPAVNSYRHKLCSSTREEEALALLPRRETPRYLHVIVTPDDAQQRRLEARATCTNMAVLKWEVVEEYTGLTADVITQQQNAVY